MRQALLLLSLVLFGGMAMAQPTANFSANIVSGCPPMVVAFTDLSSGSPSVWHWDFGNGDTSNQKNPTMSYLTAGTYTVKLTAYNASGNNTVTKTNFITVKTPPQASLSASPLTACRGVAISFTSSVTWNSPGTGTYTWDFGDGGTSSLANPTHAYTAAGTYTIKLTATNSSGCPSTDTASNLITIYPGPSVNFSASPTSICALGGTTTFTSTSSGTPTLSHYWDFGDGGNSNSSGPVSHSYFGPGNYTVRLSVTDGNGCTDSLRKNNYITVTVVTAAASVPSTACAGTTVTMNSTSSTTSGASLVWDFGDGNTQSPGTATTTHLYNVAGTYTVKLLATVGGCTDTSRSTLVINPKPAVSFSYMPTAPCPAPSLVTFTNNTTGATGYIWDFDDGFNSTSTSPTHTFTRDTFFNVKLTATSPFGCGTSLIQKIAIEPGYLDMFPMPSGFPYVIGGCVPFTVDFRDTLWQPTPLIPGTYFPYTPVYPQPITSRIWNFGDGSSTSGGARPSHTFNATGTYYTTLTTTTSNGCTFHDTLDIHVGGHSDVNFYVQPSTTACAGSLVQFYDSSFSSSGPITNWFWDFGDYNYAMLKNPTNIYRRPGTYTVTLITSQNGCTDTFKKVNYMNINYPASIPLFKVSCDTLGMVQFIDSSIGATSRLWYFGDGTTSTAMHPNHQYPGVAASYTGSLVCWNSSTGCKDSTPFVVILNNLNVSLSATDSTICPFDTITLTPIITGTGTSPSSTIAGVYWYYSTGTGPWIPINSAGMNSSFGVPWVGDPRGRYNFKVNLVDHNTCLYTKIANNLVIVGGPIAHFKATPPHGCAPAIITLTDTSNYVSGTSVANILWYFGDGTTANTTNPTTLHSYPSQGSYGISVVVTDNIGCIDSLGIPNYLGVSRPTALFTTLGSNACAGTAFTFYSSSTGLGITHLWDFGDGTTSTATSPGHVYSTSGGYSVRLIVTDQYGCKDTMRSPGPITVHGRPTASFTMDDTMNICPPLIVNFTNTSSGAISYLWNLGNNTSSVLTNPASTYSNAGIFTIRLIAINSVGCRDTVYDRVRVLGYSGIMSYSPLKGCAPFTVNFKANNVAGVPGFIYNFGDGTSAATTAVTYSHTYTTPGPHVPSITLTDNLGCSATSFGIDTIKVDGIFAGFTFTPFPACDRGTIQFIDTSKGAYNPLNGSTWKFHDGTTTTLASPSKTYPGPGKYPVVLYTSTTSGCKDSFFSQVIFYPLPHIQAAKDTTICLTDSIMLKAVGGVSYTWTPSASLNCTNCSYPYASPKVPTQYLVIGKDSNGCTNKDSMTISLRYKTITKVSPGGEICSGDTMQLVAEGASVYHWTPAEGLSDADTSSPAAYPMTDKNYVLISRLAGCIPDTDYVNIIVHPTPTVDAGIGKTIIAGDRIHLEAIANGIITKWLWTPTEGLMFPTMPITDGYPKKSTLYSITATTEFNCSATDTLRIIVLCDNSQVFLPNTFTPNGNGKNDIFYPRGKGIANIDRFRIYNRWGEVVFERLNVAVEDKRAGWDGTMNGRLLTPDIYVYTMEATCDTGEPIKWQGDVMLLR
jgi:gliding motility-associated-like protein